MPSRSPLVRVDRFDEPGLAHVAELVLDRPEALNAVSTAMAQAIADATTALSADPSVRCVVLTSSHDREDFGDSLSTSSAAGFVPKDQLSGAAVAALVA